MSRIGPRICFFLCSLASFRNVMAQHWLATEILWPFKHSKFGPAPLSASETAVVSLSTPRRSSGFRGSLACSGRY